MLTRKQFIEKQNELTRLRNTIYKSKLRKYRYDIKTNEKCAVCGENDPNILEFAHYDRSKKTINFSHNLSINKLQSELMLGRFLCVWCHRLDT